MLIIINSSDVLRVIEVKVMLLLIIFCLCTGKYHQYDTIVYPKECRYSSSYKRSWSDRAKSAINFFGVFGSNKDEIPDSFTPFDHAEANMFCLFKYLQQYQEILNAGDFIQGHDIHTVAVEIAHICESLSKDYISDPKNRVIPKTLKEEEFLPVSCRLV